ncbi:MAG TPA: MXAN_6230/SCO0854 family RING domain-containing protein, partial [Kofleriaceae bacterium]
GEPVAKHTGTLTLLELGFDLLGIAKQRFARLLRRTTPLSPDDRDEVEAVIDSIGPSVMTWLPERIAVKETMAIVSARLLLISPNRAGMMRDLAPHVRTATDVLRVAAVVMGANAELVEPMRLGSLGRGLRRALLEALERLPLEDVVEDMARHTQLWKRVGERLHPFEHAAKLPNTVLAFAVVRGTKLARTTLGAMLKHHAVKQPFLYLDDDRIKAVAWAGPIEDALRMGNPRSALARLTHRPGELLRRADQLVRIAQVRQIDALQTILKAVELASAKGPPATMLTLASHVARRGRTWPRRVFFPKGEVLRAWGTDDNRVPLRGDAIAMMVGSIRRQLVARAEQRRQFPRAVIDRALVDLLIPVNERTSSRAKLAWPRGSEIGLPPGQTLRLFLHWEEPASARVDLDLSIALFDKDWRHTGTCDYTNLVVGEGAAVHSGDLTSAPSPLGASEFVDLHLERLAMLGARHLVMVVFSYNDVPFEQLTHGFAGLMVAPQPGQYFDPRAVTQRFDLRGKSVINVPLTIDLGERRLRWLDVHIRGRKALHDVGGYRAALAHIGRDFADALGTHSRPTLWDLACIHAAARANVIYIRERDGQFTTYRRRDNESKVTRLSRLMSGAADDGRVSAVPAANAPTWFALVNPMALPTGSTGYVLDARGMGSEVEQLSAADLVAELAR